MTTYGFFRSIQLVIFVALFAVVGVVIIGGLSVTEISREISYHSRFGVGWQSQYEQDFGPLTIARTRLGIAVAGVITLSGICVWLYRLLREKKPEQRRPGWFGRSKHRYGSHEERIMHYRSKALVRVYFGVPAILAGVALVLFQFGFFENPSHETVLGIFIFLLGYFSVISGCWWWVKSKSWSEAVVFIAFMPLVVLFIPFVRLILLPLLPVAMVMMPLILVAVVLALPDKSGVNRRRHERHKRRDFVNRL